MGNDAELSQLAATMRVSESEAVRRAIHLMTELIEHHKQGGELILKKGRKRERIRFTF